MPQMMSLLLATLFTVNAFAQSIEGATPYPEHWYDEIVVDLGTYQHLVSEERIQLMRNLDEAQVSDELYSQRLDEFDEKAEAAYQRILRVKEEQARIDTKLDSARKKEACTRTLRFPITDKLNDVEGDELPLNLVTPLMYIAVPVGIGIDVITYPVRAIGGFPEVPCHK